MMGFSTMANMKKMRSKKTKQNSSHRTIYRETLNFFGIYQAYISERTLHLERRYPDRYKYVGPDQINRYLQGTNDLMGKALLTLEAALPPEAKRYFRSKMELMDLEAGLDLIPA